jgi:RNA polymerase sigma-70 factor (ECF subfamily)
MDGARTTCWTLIEGAASGRKEDREEFSRRYLDVVRAYLRARWKGTPWIQEVDDAAQELFVECFRTGGLLDHVDPARAGGFRAFLYGAARNVARRVERRQARQHERQAPSPVELDDLEQDEATLSRAFDRAWAIALIREAIERLADQSRTREADDDAARRMELLRLRFQEDLPIRDIAHRWKTDAAIVHRQYARARDEFKKMLLEVVAFHSPGSAADVKKECSWLLALVG